VEAAVAHAAAVGVAGGVEERAQLIKIALAGIELANLLLRGITSGHTAGWLSKDDGLRLRLGRQGDAAIKSVAMLQPSFLVPPLLFTGVVDAMAQIVYFVPQFVEPTETIRIVRLHTARHGCKSRFLCR
jgi:hypothetical protein